MSAKSASYGLGALLTLAWPVIVARSSQAVIGFSDALMSAPLGEAGLAAVTTGAMNTFMITILPMGVVFIGQSFAAQLDGKGQRRVAVRYAWYGLGLAMVAGLLAATSIPLIGPLLGTLGYEAEVHRGMTAYLELRILAVGAIVATEALGNWYGGLGNTRLHMVAGVIAMVINVFLNWVLIFGNLGMPAMGVEGAAIASLVATWIGFGVLAFAFLTGVSLPGISPRPTGLKNSELLRMLRFGLPHGINWFLEFTAFALFINIVVADLGTVVLAAMMVVININSVSFMPAFGLSSAGAILTGRLIGEGRPDEVGGVVRRTLAVALVWQGSVGLIYLFAPTALMRWFSPDAESGAQLVEIGAVLLAISAAWQLFDAVGMTIGETLRSAGDTTWTLWARMAVAWVFFVPAAFISVRAFDGGHVAAMICVVSYLALLSGVLAWRYRSGGWRDIDLTGVEPDLI